MNDIRLGSIDDSQEQDHRRLSTEVGHGCFQRRGSSWDRFLARSIVEEGENRGGKILDLTDKGDIGRVREGEESVEHGTGCSGEEIERSKESSVQNRRGCDPPFGGEDVEGRSDDSSTRSGQSSADDLIHQRTLDKWMRMTGGLVDRSGNRERTSETVDHGENDVECLGGWVVRNQIGGVDKEVD
jgi:hypothetical protein